VTWKNKIACKRLAVLLLSMLIAGCAALVTPNFTTELSALRSGEYTLDPEHAYVHFSVGHLGLSKIIGRFNTVEGSLDFEPENITQLQLQGKLLASSIDVNNTDLEDTLRGADWIAAAAHPEIEFRSTSTALQADNSIEIAGELSLRGQTRPIVLLTTFNGGADNILTGKYTLGFSASTTILRSDFGMDAFAALVGDEIVIEMHGEFQRN